MKLTELNTLGLSTRGREEVEFDHVEAIIHDEFSRPTPIGGEKTDYRLRGIDRIIKAELPLYNNCNITFAMLKRYVILKCPYCGEQMTTGNGGGNNNTSSMEYSCKCGATANISLDNNGALGFALKET